MNKSNMDDQFVPPSLAHQLNLIPKFKQEVLCICVYNSYQYLKGKIISSIDGDYLSHDKFDDRLPVPTFQQVFDWFETTYKLASCCELKSINHEGKNYQYKIVNFTDEISSDTTSIQDGFTTMKLARTGCIYKLIQYVS